MANVSHNQTHVFSEGQTSEVQEKLLAWFDKNKREMPWRDLNDIELNNRAYRVWVSEMMLQQTQVATVIAYYNKWIKKWPTVSDLANATPEEVNEMWAGLGYYSRGRRLYEGAQKVMHDFGGKIPSSSRELMKLPGVGQYTAAAIASIAFNEQCGVVDGNVVRVLSRMRSIGSDTSQQKTMQHFWKLTNQIVDTKRPGDFNQALMELGAIVCTPKSPSCATCPVKSCCKALELTKCRGGLQKLVACGSDSSLPASVHKSTDIEDCELCLPVEKWQPSCGVTNFPQKSGKTRAKEEQFAVIIAYFRRSSQQRYLITQRPDHGLLASLWEFPSVPVDSSWSNATMKKGLSENLDLYFHGQSVTHSCLDHIGQVKHTFSHRLHIYHVYQTEVTVGRLSHLNDEMSQLKRVKWVTSKELLESAVPAGVKKIFQLCQSTTTVKPSRKRLRSGSRAAHSAKTQQIKIDKLYHKV